MRKLRGAVLLLAAVAGMSGAQAAEDVVLDRSVTSDGSVLTIGRSAALLTIQVEGKSAISVRGVPATDLFPTSAILAAKGVRLRSGDVVLAVTTQGAGTYRYHWVRTGARIDDRWTVSEIFSSPRSFRIVELRNPERDGIEITFRHWAEMTLDGAAPIDERIYRHPDPTPDVAGSLIQTSFGGSRPDPEPVAKGSEPVLDPPAPVEREGPKVPLGVGLRQPAAPAEPEPSPPILAHVRVAADGEVSFAGPSAEPARVGSLGGTPDEQHETLRSLGREMDRIGSAHVHRDGTSKVRLSVEAAPSAPWRWVQWAIQTAASQKAQIFRVRFAGADPVDLDLPRDSGLPVRQGSEPRRIRLVLRRQETAGGEGQTTIRLGREELPLPAAGRPAAIASLRRRIWEEILEPGTGGVVETPPSSGTGVPAADVIEVIRAFHAEGVRDVHLAGAATPFPVHPR